MILVTRKDFSIERAVSSLKSKRTGAVVSFLGVVRGFTRNERVTKLEFEAERAAAMKRLREMRVEAMRRFNLQDVTIIHRVGTLKVSENIVLISVAASHRREAFAACRYLIEELKRSVPIWKKEHTKSGARWVPARGLKRRTQHLERTK